MQYASAAHTPTATTAATGVIQKLQPTGLRLRFRSLDGPARITRGADAMSSRLRVRDVLTANLLAVWADGSVPRSSTLVLYVRRYRCVSGLEHARGECKADALQRLGRRRESVRSGTGTRKSRQSSTKVLGMALRQRCTKRAVARRSRTGLPMRDRNAVGRRSIAEATLRLAHIPMLAVHGSSTKPTGRARSATRYRATAPRAGWRRRSPTRRLITCSRAIGARVEQDDKRFAPRKPGVGSRGARTKHRSHRSSTTFAAIVRPGGLFSVPARSRSPNVLWTVGFLTIYTYAY